MFAFDRIPDVTQGVTGEGGGEVAVENEYVGTGRINVCGVVVIGCAAESVHVIAELIERFVSLGVLAVVSDNGGVETGCVLRGVHG